VPGITAVPTNCSGTALRGNSAHPGRKSVARRRRRKRILYRHANLHAPRIEVFNDTRTDIGSVMLAEKSGIVALSRFWNLNTSPSVVNTTITPI
jgi:hypothetical protein